MEQKKTKLTYWWLEIAKRCEQKDLYVPSPDVIRSVVKGTNTKTKYEYIREIAKELRENHYIII